MPESHEQTVGDFTVRIERDLCIGSGNCVNLAPEVFQLDERNLVAFQEEVGGATPVAIESERVEEACVLCPVDALLVFDADGEQIVP